MEKINNKSNFSGRVSTLFAFIIALIIFMIFPLLTEMFATELREASAVISEMIIKLTGMEVARNGTILSLNRMVFDIVPACDGSNMLRVIFAFSVLLVSMKATLTIPKKIITLLISIPVALFMNGFRVSLLVIFSYFKGFVISEGFLHTMLGIFSFILAFLIILAFIDFLSSKSQGEEKNVETAEILILALIILVMVHSTFIFSCIKNWRGTLYNVNDLYGYALFIPAIIIYVIAWFKYPDNYTNSKTGIVFFTIFVLFAEISQLPGKNNYILGCTFLGTIAMLAVIEKGWRFTFTTSPILLTIFLSYPKTTEFVNDFLGFTGVKKAFVIKSSLAVLALLIFYLLYRVIPKKDTDKRVKVLSKKCKLSWMILLLTGIILVKAYDVNYISKINTSSTAQLNYIMGDWIGTDISDDTVDDYYGNWPITNRIYTKDGRGSSVGVMIVSSEGNRQNIHTPEYCQYPMGWRVTNKSYYTFTTSNGYDITATHLLLKNNKGNERTFLYWFDCGTETTATYNGFIISDIIQKFIGNKTNWNLYVVWSDEDFKQIEPFLSVFKRNI